MSDDRLRELLGQLFQAHPWHGIPPGDPAGTLTVFIEITPADTVKYELDKPSGQMRIDRPQRYSNLAPTLYGFIPQTYCGQRVGARCLERTGVRVSRGDGDPMDVCILTEKDIGHGNFILRARPIGGLRMVDADEADDKIIMVLESDITYGHARELADVPAGVIDRLRHYFLTYKQIPGEAPRKVQIAEVYGRDEAVATIAASVDDYRDKFGAPESRLAELRRLLRG